MSRPKDDDPARPFPAVDDPLLAATLAKVTGAAASLSSARTAGPAAARVPTATVVVDDGTLLVDDDADPLSAPARAADAVSPAPQATRAPASAPQVSSTTASTPQTSSAPASTTPHVTPDPASTAHATTAVVSTSSRVAPDPASTTPRLTPHVTPAKAGVQALPSPPPDRAMTSAGNGRNDDHGTPDDPDDGNNGDDNDDHGTGNRRPRRSPLALLVVALAVLAVLGIGALILFGRVNTTHYYLACEPERVVAERGRGFPPWGTHPLDGKQWSPIKIPPQTECVPRETDNPEELGDWYRTFLVDRASALLTAREVTAVEDAAALLQQALLHTRSDARRSEREDIERLLGDVDYWRATAKLHAASTALTDAAKQFDAAAAERPRHVSDAAAWASHVRGLAANLLAGPNSSRASTLLPPPSGSSPARAPAPLGTILPVDPLSPATGSAGSATAPAPPAPPSPPPTGGVLL